MSRVGEKGGVMRGLAGLGSGIIRMTGPLAPWLVVVLWSSCKDFTG